MVLDLQVGSVDQQRSDVERERRNICATQQQPNTANAIAKEGSGTDEDPDKTRRGRLDRNTLMTKRGVQNRLGLFGSRTRLEEVTPERGNLHAAVRARDAHAFPQLFDSAPSIFPGHFSTNSRSKLRT